MTINVYSQKLKVITVDKTEVDVNILDESTKKRLINQFDGKQDNSIRKKWTSRTFTLSDGRVIVEFYDKQAALIDNLIKFEQLKEVRFTKNKIDFLKKNISYKIELGFEQGKSLIETERPKRLNNLKSEIPEHLDFEVYELNSSQILFMDNSKNNKAAIIYENLKTLASDNSDILEQLYGFEDDEILMKKLAQGDALMDYEPNEHLIYPKYIKDVIKNHQLSPIENRVYVANDFYGNLYQSENGYYVLIDEVNQKNGAGNKMLILTLRIYETLQEVRNAQARYEEFKNESIISEHFYQKISDKYGNKFPEYINQLVESLPSILNFDKEQLTFDSTGIALIDEALLWNGDNYELFDSWFPPVLAYYGQLYILNKKDGQWTTTYDKENKVWIPQIILRDKTSAFDMFDFYKDLSEGPIPLQWAGDFDGTKKKMRSNRRKNSH